MRNVLYNTNRANGPLWVTPGPTLLLPSSLPSFHARNALILPLLHTNTLLHALQRHPTSLPTPPGSAKLPNLH